MASWPADNSSYLCGGAAKSARSLRGIKFRSISFTAPPLADSAVIIIGRKATHPSIFHNTSMRNRRSDISSFFLNCLSLVFLLVGTSVVVIKRFKTMESPAPTTASTTQNIKANRQVEGVLNDMHYLLYLPPSYRSEGPELMPLICFLHGAGESRPYSREAGTDALKIQGPPKIVEEDPEHPLSKNFVVVSPQSSGGRFGSSKEAKQVVDILEHVAASHQVDRSRIYLTGLSMGGYGTYAIAAQYPSLFSAIAPVCGGGNTRYAETYKQHEIGVWIFHGENDSIIPFSESKQMLKALQAVQLPSLRYSFYPESPAPELFPHMIGHASWEQAYATKELYSWFLSHQKK